MTRLEINIGIEKQNKQLKKKQNFNHLLTRRIRDCYFISWRIRDENQGRKNRKG